MNTITEKSIGVDGNVFAERRKSARRRVLKGGTMTFNRGYSAFECLVRNQSEGGAHLSLGETFALPMRFNLMIAGEEGSHKARVCWRSPTAVGVAFED